MDPAELRALNESFAAIERAIDNLNARLTATMAFVAAVPGADLVETAELERRLRLLWLAPVLSEAPTRPEAFVQEAVQQLRHMAEITEVLARSMPEAEAKATVSLRATRAD